MVGSIVMTVKEGDEVKRGQEVSGLPFVLRSLRLLISPFRRWDTLRSADRQSSASSPLAS